MTPELIDFQVCKSPDRTLQSYAKLSPIDVAGAFSNSSASTSNAPLRSSSLTNVTFNRGSALGMGVGLKRPVGTPDGRVDAGKEAFKKMKVDLPPALVTKPFKSVGGLGKPFKAPSFTVPSAASKAPANDDNVEVVKSRPAPVSRKPTVRASVPEPVSEDDEEDDEKLSPPKPKPVARTKAKASPPKAKVPNTNEPERHEPPPRKKTSAPKPKSRETIDIDDSDSDMEILPSPKAAPLSPDLGRIWDDDEMDVTMDDHTGPSSSDQDVVLLHEHSAKVPESKRRKSYEVLRKALFKVFISGEGSGRLWGKLPRAPASSDRRCVLLSSFSALSIGVLIIGVLA